MTFFVIIAQIQKPNLNKILNNLTSLRASTSFKITTNILQPTTHGYMNPFSQVETSVKGKYTFDSIMNYDFKYVSCVTFQKLHNIENFEKKKSN